MVEELRSKVFSRAWFHRIDLGNGIITPGIDDSPAKLRHIGLPEDLTGKTVLDVGAYDGFFSFEAERRGADRVVAADHYCWTREGMGDGRGFALAHEALNSKVERVFVRVEDISRAALGDFDIVLFLGILYHAPDPLLYLRNVRSVCKDKLILETHIDALDYPRPAMVFYPGATLNDDPSNFWGPNLLAVKEMLKETGFQKVIAFPPYNPRRVVAHAFV
jgi:tRNA (mo5U34)-methyltransferase